ARAGQGNPERLRGGRAAARVAEAGPGEAAGGHAGHRLLPLAALQVLPALELLDRGRRAGAGDPEALRARHRHPRPHPPAAHQPHRQHPFPRHAVDGMAVAVRPGGSAQAHHPDEPARPVQSQRRPRHRHHRRAGERPGPRGPQPVEPEPDPGVGCLRRVRQPAAAAGHADELLKGAMMRARRGMLVLGFTALTLGGGLLGARWLERANAQQGTTVVTLCDNHTTTSVPSGPKTREQGQAIADALMSQWRQKNPDRDWVKDELEKHTLVQPADNSALIGRGQGQTYGQISKRDVDTWTRESMVMAADGSRVFHDANELGSTIAVS